MATRRSRDAASRTWATEPGAEPISDEKSVCTESITQTSGRSRSSVAQTVSSSVSARISTFPAPPRRAARSFTCAVDSSPVTSKARRSFEMAASAESSSVDLPTPGSPPTSTSEAGTSPPPSTRSSSGTPVESRSASSATTSTSRNGGRPAFAGEAPRGAGASAIIVPNSPQPGHFPSQRPDEVPHSVHTCWTAAGFAIAPYGTRGPGRNRYDFDMRLRQLGDSALHVSRSASAPG